MVHYKILLWNSRTGRTKFGIGDGLRWEYLAELLEHYTDAPDGTFDPLSLTHSL